MFGGVATTETVVDNKAVGASQVKNREILKRRGAGALVANVVPKLNDKANGGEGTFFEV